MTGSVASYDYEIGSVLPAGTPRELIEDAVEEVLDALVRDAQLTVLGPAVSADFTTRTLTVLVTITGESPRVVMERSSHAAAIIEDTIARVLASEGTASDEWTVQIGASGDPVCA